MLERYPDYEYALAATQLVLAMVGMGAALGPRDFAGVFRAPKGLALGIALQLIMVPGLAVLVARLAGVGPGIAVGLILVAAVPGGSLSNIYTYLGRGNAALSISLTGVATLGCLITTPAILGLLAAEYLSDAFRMPVARIVGEIALTLLLPLAAGMVIGPRLGRWRWAFSRWCIRGAVFIIGIVVVGSLGSGRIQLDAYGWAVPLTIIVFAVAAHELSRMGGRGFRLPGGDVLALGVEVTIRNVNLALLMKASLFPAVAGVPDPIADGVLFVLLFYGGTAMVVALPPVLVGRRRPASPARGAESRPPSTA